jgi:hypothetical protein
MSTERGQGPSFKGQMMESITARMEREKAEREKAALERADSASSRNFAFTFSTDIYQVPLHSRQRPMLAFILVLTVISSAALHGC